MITLDAGSAIEPADPVVAEFEVSGNSLVDQLFQVRRTITPQSEEADSPLDYMVEALD